jgi:hypothetical protein
MSRFFIFLIVLIIFSGCNDTKRPDGLPKLYSCKITIRQDKSPVEGVRISLYDGDVSNKWSIGGVTDASGTAVLQTHGQFAGVPSGKFKVVLAKTETEGGTPSDEFMPTKKQETVRIYSLIDKKYLEESTTTLEINIENKSVTETFEIGPATRILIQTIKPGDV